MSHKNAAYDLTPLGYINSNLEAGLVATLSGFSVDPTNPERFNDDDEGTQTGSSTINQNTTAYMLYDFTKLLLISNIYLDFNIVASLGAGATSKTYAYLDVSKDATIWHTQQVGYVANATALSDSSVVVNQFFDVWRKARYVKVRIKNIADVGHSHFTGISIMINGVI